MSRRPIHYRIADWFAGLSERISDAWHRLVGPIERAFGRLGEGAFGALDSFEGVESAVVGFVRFLFWPVLALGRVAGRLLPAGDGGAGRLGRLFAYPIRLLQRLANWLNLDWLVVWIGWLLTPVWWPIAQLLGFANAWLATRRPREVALATPAVVLAAPFIYVAIQGAVLGKSGVKERYRVAVREAAEAGDYAIVDLYERKLAQMGDDTSRAKYRTAMQYAEAGDLAGAYSRMIGIASPDRPGYAPAHAWLAQKLVVGEISPEIEPGLTSDAKAGLHLAERHLDQLEELDIAGPELARLRAFVLSQTDRGNEAIAALEPYASASLDATAMQFQILARLGRGREAQEKARAFLELLEERRGRGELSLSEVATWVDASRLLRLDRELEKALRAWQEIEPENDKPKRLLGEYRQNQATQMVASPTASPDRTAEAIVAALRSGAPEGWGVAIVSQIAVQRSSDRRAERIWTALSREEVLPNAIVGSMAVSAAGQGNIEEARSLFVRLFEAEGKTATSLNNYAWTLTQEPSPDFGKALDYVNQALERQPGDYRFRETRGQIHLQLKRWEAAIEDLEYALNGLPESSEIHESLAVAYEAISKPTLAAIHRRQAEDL